MKTAFYLFIFMILSLSGLLAQQPYEPYRITGNINLDGKMTEAEWLQTPVENAFMQTDPDPGAKPTELTEVRILYNDDFLFVAIRCYDREPEKLIRLELERDFPIGQEDGTAVIIDSYHDCISGFDFLSNTLDARWDAQATSDGGSLADSYNTFWDVRSTIDSLGYTTEYRIPFSSLRFESSPEVIMAFRIARLIKRKNELITYPACDPTTTDAWTNISFAREIIFRDLKSHVPFYISPYVIASYYEENVLNADSTAYEKNSYWLPRKYFADNKTLDKIISNIGLDIKYGLSKNLTLDVTLNTDFAQAEVDDRIINLSKYEVNLPEKRSFFLESANYLRFGFPSGNELFISRTIGKINGVIVPIIGGVRMTGKINSWQMGVLNMQTLGVDALDIAPYNFTVLRTRKEIDSLGSFIGGIITNRSNTADNDFSNQSIGIDFVKRINQQFAVEGGIASTLENFTSSEIGKTLYYHAGFFQSANAGLTYGATFDLIGEDVDPAMGFIDDNNYGAINTNIGYQFLMKPESALQYVYFFTDNNYHYKLESGNRETFYSGFATGIDFKSGANIEFSPFMYKIDSLSFDWAIDENNIIPKGVYHMFNNSIECVSPQKSNYSASLYVSFGGFYGGNRLFISPDITWYFGKHLNASATYEYNYISFDNVIASLPFESNLLRLSLIYNLNTKISLKVYSQFDDLSDITSTNLRFRYNPIEGTDLFIVFNQGINSERARLDPHLPMENNQALTIKFVKTFGV